MNTLTVRVQCVVIKEITYEGIDFEQEEDYCEEAREQVSRDLECDGYDTGMTDSRIKWS